MSETSPPVGGEIDSWCTRCKLELNHTVVAKVDGQVKRVQCLTCGGQHNHSARGGGRGRSAPAERASKPTRRVTKAPVDDGRPARTYSVAETFTEDDVIQHPRYGRGLVLQTRGDKIDVKFTSGKKTLVHGRQPSA